MPTPVPPAPQRHAYSVDDYYRMVDAGILRPESRVELIEGEIIDMVPIGSRHAAAVNRIAQALTLTLGKRVVVSIQAPVRLNRYSEPQPDIALLRPRADFYAAAHPGPADLSLLVEVAASSLRFDRDVKLPLYARHGIPEVWLVDIENSRLEIYSQPQMNGYVGTRALVSTLTPIDVPGMAGMAVDLSGLFS